jgi:MoaA/NifB/PqqE/SkfB family radical SAM enzyme
MNIAQKIRTFTEVIGCRYLGARYPISTQFALTNRCPWRCAYCGISDKKTSEVTTDEAKHIVRELAGAGNMRLHLVGGEPLLRDDIGAIVQEARSCGLFVTVATTGFRIPEKWDDVKDIDIFFLSFDGPRDIHEKQRGEKSYDVLFSAIEFLKARHKRFWTTTVLTRQNREHIDYILQVAQTHNFLTNFHLLYFTSTPDHLEASIHPGTIGDEYAMNDQECRETLRYLMEKKKTALGRHIGSSSLYFESLLKWKDYSCVYGSEKSGLYDCMAGKMYCYIDANGDLYPCCDVMGKVAPRNILKEGFMQAFKGMPDPPCKSCIVACYTELNLMFSLRLKSILNWGNKV